MIKQALKTAGIILNGKKRIDTSNGTKTVNGIADLIIREVVNKIKVQIEVTGGIAEVTSCPENIEVEIIDHDIIKIGGIR